MQTTSSVDEYQGLQEEIFRPTVVVSIDVVYIIQEFLLIWLEINMDSTKGDNAFLHSIADLCSVVSNIYSFVDIDKCINFPTDFKYKDVFIVVCDEIGDHIIMPFLHQIPQLTAIVILSNDKSKYEQTITKNWTKFKSVFTDITCITKSIK